MTEPYAPGEVTGFLALAAGHIGMGLGMGDAATHHRWGWLAGFAALWLVLVWLGWEFGKLYEDPLAGEMDL